MQGRGGLTTQKEQRSIKRGIPRGVRGLGGQKAKEVWEWGISPPDWAEGKRTGKMRSKEKWALCSQMALTIGTCI